MRSEREYCCDDRAVQLCGDQHLYAEALVAMADLRDALPPYALGATGGHFLLRINRLLEPRVLRRGRTLSAAVIGVICSTVALILVCNHMLIGAAADRVRTPSDLATLSSTIAEAFGTYRSDTSTSFPELGDAVHALATEAGDLSISLDRLVEALNQDPRPNFITRQIVAIISVAAPDQHDPPIGTYGTSKQRQKLIWHLHNRARSMRKSDPDRAGRYARAALILGSQEELYVGADAVERLLTTSYFFAQLTPKQEDRIRRGLAEHKRVTALALSLEQQVIQKLDESTGATMLTAGSPQQELDALVGLAAPRRDIQWRVVTLYQQWLRKLDDPSKAAARSAARAWRQRLADATFVRWLDEAEASL